MLPATGRQHRGCIIPQAVTHSLVLLKMGKIIARNMLSWVELLRSRYCLHLVGCLYYLYQWCTVKQISDSEIYLLIKYIKSLLWRVAKRLSYIEDGRCLKVNMGGREGSSENQSNNYFRPKCLKFYMKEMLLEWCRWHDALCTEMPFTCVPYTFLEVLCTKGLHTRWPWPNSVKKKKWHAIYRTVIELLHSVLGFPMQLCKRPEKFYPRFP